MATTRDSRLAPPPAASPPPADGLAEAEAARRRGGRARRRGGRSYASIVRANILTPFNLILATFGGLTIALGDWRDSLFLGILVSNATIGIAQEVRAKRALDRLASLVAPTATVVRDGVERRVPAEEVVVGDLVRLQPGDGVVADGVLQEATGLRVDESVLTGESRPVARAAGDEVRSGSFVAEGVGSYSVTAVGSDSYAARVTSEARTFRHPRSPLERGLNRLLFALLGVMLPLGVLLGAALWERRARSGEAVTTAVAAVVTLVPEGLILLASLTYAVAALRMARRGALAQQLNAIESLASVDVVCLDKTGTLTDASPHLLSTVAAPGVSEAELARALGAYAAGSRTRNPTAGALAAAFPAPAPTVEEELPFSSRRRFGAIRLDGVSVVVGAPEVVAPHALADAAEEEARRGRRVVAVARTRAPLEGEALPAALEPLGLAVIGERLRPEARETVTWFLRQGVELKVLSGDRPETVAAVAAEAGIPLAGPPLDGRDLGDAAAVVAAPVVGRISPDGKRAVVEALRDGGRYVAMVGDGVNDVPALKAARLAIAQGSGTEMARAVADLVLVSGDFAAVPALVAEGRQILRNVARVAKLFVTKSAFAAFLIVSIGLTPTAYPLLPRHLTLVASLAIGIPAFFLALAPSSGRFRAEGFLRDVGRFAVPAGTAAGLAVLSSYLFALQVLDLRLVEARTTAATTLLLVGLYLILVLEWTTPRRGALVAALCAALAALYFGAALLPLTRSFYALAVPGPTIVAVALGGAALGVVWLRLTDDRFRLGGVRENR